MKYQITQHKQMSFTMLKEGDKVRVRSDIASKNHWGGTYCNETMQSRAGQILTVKRIAEDGMEVEENGWFWNFKMLEIVEVRP